MAVLRTSLAGDSDPSGAETDRIPLERRSSRTLEADMDHISNDNTQLAAIDLVERWSAHNYHPLPVVVVHAENVWVYDAAGKVYLDMLAGYSALNFGHRHPRLLAAAREQLGRVTLTSRAFHNEQLGPFCKALAELCGMEAVLPMNTGAESVETAIKLARRWGYDVKGITPDQAKIVICANNFHGRTVTIVGFSTDPIARNGFGPFTPGFEIVPYGDLNALEAALDDNTAALLVEPIQGEAGVIVPPPGYLRGARELCRERNVLFMADEIQSGLGRTGRTFACEHEGIEPDVYILGKALGGGIYPLSAVVTQWDVMKVMQPGEHGSTFGGNPLACRIGREVLAMLADGEIQERSATLGRRLLDGLRNAALSKVKDVHGMGLWAGLDLLSDELNARQACELLMEEGLLCKDAHDTVRLSPPLVIEEAEIDWALERIARVLG
jgi:ornithine--oxo-acid transaminase